MPLNLPPPKANGNIDTTARTVDSASAASRPAIVEADHAVISSASSSTSTSAKPVSYNNRALGGLHLPPPKTKGKQASSQPKKFVLDLPTARVASENDDGQGPSKRAKTEAGPGASGLRGLLPEPKAKGVGGMDLPPPKARPAANGHPISTTPSLLPHTLKNKDKGKSKATEIETREETVAVPSASREAGIGGSQDEIAEPEDQAVLDFFGLGASNDDDDDDEPDETTPSAPTSSDFFGFSNAQPSSKIFSDAKPSSSAFSAAPSTSSSMSRPRAAATPVSSVKISAAPATIAPDLALNYYATIPLPTPGDPYPGFYQKPDGSWAAKRPDEWEVWSKANWGAQQHEAEEAEVPKDFEQSGIDVSLDVRAEQLRKAGGFEDSRPSKITDEDKKKMEEEKIRAKSKQKNVSYVARSRHQLSTLIQDAQVNRQELEDRISQMKTNKRGGGAKYGF